MNERKSIAGIIIPIILIIIFIMCAIVYCIFFMNKQTTNPINNEISNIDNSSTKNNNVTNTVSEFTMTESEFPKVDGATAMLPMIGEITKSVLNYSDEEAQKYLDENTHGKTAKVYASLINKEKDLIFVSEPSDDILKSAEDNNVEFEMVGIGLDGFVFLVNKENKVDSLTLEQIQKIYTGEITNWSNVGGEDAEIIAYQREANSGSQNLMEKMVMQGLKMKKPENTNLMIGSMSGLIDGIASYSNSKNSIGYSIYLYAKEQYVKDNVKFLAINGVKPTDETIANRSYPLTKVVYAEYRKDEAQNSNVIKLVNWLKTEEGKETAKNLTQGFAVGMGGSTEATCGAIIGAVNVLGMINKDASKTMQGSRRIINRFKEQNGTVICKELKGLTDGVVKRECIDCVKDAA